jgi:hypothetical protein
MIGVVSDTLLPRKPYFSFFVVFGKFRFADAGSLYLPNASRREERHPPARQSLCGELGKILSRGLSEKFA